MSRSPIADCAAGSCGASRMAHQPILRAEEPDDPPKARVIMRNGKWTDEATPEDRARVEPIPTTVRQFRESKMLRDWAAEVVRRKHTRSKVLGRPRQYHHLREEIAALRKQGVSWTEIGRRLDINPETARTVLKPKGKR